MFFQRFTALVAFPCSLALGVISCTVEPGGDSEVADAAPDGHTHVIAVTAHDGGPDSGSDAHSHAGTKGPVVFFAAHPDDETIGMAGAILQAVSEGRPVYIELMTHGEASFVRSELVNGQTDSWHPGRHLYPLSVADFGEARVREFQDAMTRMGVTGVHVSDFGNLALTSTQVTERIDYWLSRNLRGLSLRGTAGAQDPQHMKGNGPNPDHAAVWNALVASGYEDVLGYCIYQAETGRCAYDKKVDVNEWCAGKRDALDAYETWDPPKGRYGIAFHSTYGLLKNVGARCVEYVVLPTPDRPATIDNTDPLPPQGEDVDIER